MWMLNNKRDNTRDHMRDNLRLAAMSGEPNTFIAIGAKAAMAELQRAMASRWTLPPQQTITQRRLYFSTMLTDKHEPGIAKPSVPSDLCFDSNRFVAPVPLYWKNASVLPGDSVNASFGLGLPHRWLNQWSFSLPSDRKILLQFHHGWCLIRFDRDRYSGVICSSSMSAMHSSVPIQPS